MSIIAVQRTGTRIAYSRLLNAGVRCIHLVNLSLHERARSLLHLALQ